MHVRFLGDLLAGFVLLREQQAVVVIYNGLKDKEQVVTWMRKALEERSSWLVRSKVEPRFALLREDPDFAALLKAMKFP